MISAERKRERERRGERVAQCFLDRGAAEETQTRYVPICLMQVGKVEPLMRHR